MTNTNDAARMWHKDYHVDSFGFPATGEELGKLQTVRRLGGSTGADLARAPDGTLFVRKSAGSTTREHLRSECQADAFYRAAGVNVPQFRLYDDQYAPIKLAKYIEDAVSLQSWWNTTSQNEHEAMTAKLRKDLTIDILLGNWDVVGLFADNILIDKSGVPYRIDNGGALEFRAQGAKKTLELWSANGNVDDLWTMTGNGSRIHLYVESTISKYLGQTDVLDMVNEILARQRSWQLEGKDPLSALSPKNRAVVQKRLETIRELANWGNRCDRIAIEHKEERGFILPNDVKLTYVADLTPIQYGNGLDLLCYQDGKDLFSVSQKSWATSRLLYARVNWHDDNKLYKGLLGDMCVDPRIVMMHILAGKLMILSGRARVHWQQAQKEINAVLPTPTLGEAQQWLEKNHFTGENAYLCQDGERYPGWNILFDNYDFEYLTPEIQKLYDKYKRLAQENETQQNQE
ncbi:MAG: hypothetical protein Q4G03_11890 [Planctomycetia bacterium]|nr:hypothetical protein [Planctomycetia bacterium]